MGKHRHIELTEEQRTELEKLIRTGNAPARTHTRARILLLSDRSQGQKRTDRDVAEAVSCSQSTVSNVRRRFLDGGLQAALYDKGWPGPKPKFTGEIEAKLSVELGYVDTIRHVTAGELLKKTNSGLGG